MAWRMPSRYGNSGSGTAAFTPLSAPHLIYFAGYRCSYLSSGGGPHVSITDQNQLHRIDEHHHFHQSLSIFAIRYLCATRSSSNSLAHSASGNTYDMMDNIDLRNENQNTKFGKRHDRLLLSSLQNRSSFDEREVRTRNLEPQASNRHAEHDYESHDRNVHPLARHKAHECCPIATVAVVLHGRWSHTTAISSRSAILEGAIVGGVVYKVRHGPVVVEDQGLT